MILKQDKLTVKIFGTTKEMSVSAALEVSTQIKELLSRKETINMIFAAAPSQSAFLKELISYTDIDWHRVNGFHLDEYVNLSDDAPQRFSNFLKKEIFGLLPFKNVYYLDGNKPVEEECVRYTELLKTYPPDIVCLGIGENGHVAFNDPHVARFNDTEMVKVVSLDRMCRQQQVNDACFEKIEDVPEQALTLTIPALLLARYLFCIVPFKSKAEAVYNTVTGEITEACPASVLRTKENAVLYLDKGSASLLEMKIDKKNVYNLLSHETNL